MLKRTSWLSGLVVGALLAGACSSSGSDQPREVVESFPTAPVTITVWHDAEETMNKYFQEIIIPEYQRMHPNVTVEYEIYGTADIVNKILTAVATNSAPTIVDAHGSMLPTLYERNVLVPAEDAYFPDGGVQALIDKYLAGTLEAQQYQGKLYALPYQENALSLYMNNRMFEEAGLDPAQDAPKTWDDVAGLNQILTKRDSSDRITQKGFDHRVTVGDHWINFMFEALVYQAGGEVLDSSGNAVFNDSHGVLAMENWLKASVDPEVTRNESANPYLGFFTEQEAMATGGPNAGAVGELANPAMKGNWTVAPLPQIDPANPVTIHYHFDFVVSDDASPEERFVGWDFINFAMSTPEPWFEATRLLQPRTELTESAAAQAIPGMEVFLYDLEISRPLVPNTHASELQAAIGRAVQRIVLEGADIQESLDMAVQEHQQAVGG